MWKYPHGLYVLTQLSLVLQINFNSTKKLDREQPQRHTEITRFNKRLFGLEIVNFYRVSKHLRYSNLSCIANEMTLFTSQKYWLFHKLI